MQNQKPSLFRVILVDYSSLLAALFPITFWILTTYYFYTGDDGLQFFVLLSTGVTVLGIPYLFWRFHIISSVFEDGLEVQGTIMSVSFFRGRGRADYTYTHQGQKYISGNAISRTKYTRTLQSGQQVTILVDRNTPKRAFVKEIYL
ncbi:MAG TPA: DUF3592 domain-containing protein [Anaerolineales bacterium]|nr:DUF3592 domain-containing protein [Anaerolineales bacterium]